MPDNLKRYKSGFFFKCLDGHQNLKEHRTLAKSPQEASAISLNKLKQEKCMYCSHTFVGSSYLGTEEITRYPEYLVLGYVCKCGEKVEVFKEETGVQISFPNEITVECSSGHSRKLLNAEFLSLERWQEKSN